ncbi:ShlB/FhaC/HecB family hemolysin secretion/activation protein [Ramlibacter sp. MAHUQ-53]|uniref:ShlB/FhaC/HecB family hemolysin secretion/activation protein n=1 Tax=unclassified Ramlibacter TaxID=2617605 RepID=UPI0036441585
MKVISTINLAAPMMRTRQSSPLLGGLLGGLLVTAALAASHPAWAAADAGEFIRRYQDETARRLAPRPSGAAPLPPEAQSRSRQVAATSRERIQVAAFEVTGVTRFTADEVAAVLQPFLGRELDTEGLHRAADALNARYRQAGYFVARVFIPPQQVAGTLRLEVHEGVLDANGAYVANRGQRVDTKVVQGILDAHLRPGEPLRRDSVERALLLAEDLPGITTASVLYPGERVGTARLRTTVTDLPLVSGNVDLDNFGSRSTGQTRLGTTLYLNSPSRTGDQAVARLVTSGERSRYAYLTYLAPVSPTGTRAGASLDHFSYDADDIAGAGRSSGHASDFRLYLTHPVIRSRHGNLNLRADLSHLEVSDRNELPVDAKRRIRSVAVSLQGDDDRGWGGTGLSTFGASVTTGSVDVRGDAAYEALDSSTARTAGGFTRANLQLSRLQHLGGHWEFLGRVGAQWASANLDTSQKFYLGGGTSLPGYPLGEAGGDSGTDLHLEIRRDVLAPWSGTLHAGLFVEQGWVRNHKATWPGWQGATPGLDNHLSLKSVGLNVNATLGTAWVARATLARQVGGNPMRQPATGAASDGRTSRTRAWFQAIHYF